MAGKSKATKAWARSSRVGAPQQRSTSHHTSRPGVGIQKLLSASGRYVLFDIIFMLVMLLLSLFTLSGDASSEKVLGRGALLLFYSCGILLNVYDQFMHGRGVATILDSHVWRVSRLIVALNILADIVLACGVLLLYARSEMVLLPLVLALASTRLVVQIVGKLAPGIVLTAALTGELIYINTLTTPVQGNTFAGQDFEALAVVVCFLMLSYLVWLRRRAQEVDVTRELEAARIRAERDAEVLSAQVLHADLLQSGIKAINSAIELDDLLMMIVNNAVRVLKAEQSTIGLVEEKSGHLVIRCATGIDSSELEGRHFLPGVGVAGWVIKHGEAALIQDVSLDSRYISLDNDQLSGRSTRSMLCAPLIIEQKVIGALCVTHSLSNVWTEEDERLITSFAEQAALAVYKSQLLAERTRQRNELRRRKGLITSLNAVTRSVLSSLDLPQVLDTIISRMGELATFDHALIYLGNVQTGELQLAALSGEEPYPASPELRGGSAVTKWWIQTPQSLVHQWQADGMSLLCLRLVNDKDALGYIMLARHESIPFREEERDAGRRLADAATIAIVKARLFSQVTTQQEQATALYRLMLNVNGASNRRELAPIVCKQLREITGAKAAALLLEDNEQAQITVWAADGKWAGKDTSGVRIQAHGDLFVGSTLAALNKAEPLDLLLIPNAPQQVKELFGAAEYVTIPLSSAGLIYGLLVIEPKADPSVSEEAREMVRLAVSHSTVALEKAALFEAMMRSMRQSNMLYSIATQVQSSLEASSVIDMTLQGALRAMPLQSCELYLFDATRTHLERHGKAIAQHASDAGVLLGPERISLDANPTLLEVLYSSSLLIGDLELQPGELHSSNGHHSRSGRTMTETSPVVLARLISSEDALGIVRFTPSVPPEEFVRNYTTFCNTLLTHAGGALERDHLYSRLVDSKRELEAVVLSISSAVVVADANLNVIISNNLADRLLGLTSDSYVEHRRSLVDLVDEAGLLEMLQNCITGAQPASRDLSLTLEGESLTYEAFVNPISGRDDGEVFGAVLMLRDVTSLRADERAKSDFVSMISHELRTPLNAMYGFLDITLSGKTGPLTELQTDFLSTAKQETVVLKRLIDDLLDYSRLESKTLSMEMEPLDLSSLLARVIRGAAARLAEDELSITSNVPKGLMVIGDEVRLKQVFDNLLDNAAKFTDPGGEIIFGCRVDEGRISVSVADNGCGIPPSQLDAIFDRFFQADNHSRRRKRGQGLGLAICKNIVEAHSGRISVESALGAGTTMHVELPAFTPVSGSPFEELSPEDLELSSVFA